MYVFRSVIIDANIDTVWKTIRDFDGVVHWSTGVTGARMESGNATTIGAIRYLDIVDGTYFRETLLAHSDIAHYYTYDIVDGPLACTNYVSTTRLIQITDGDKTLGIWEGTFDCDPADETILEEIVGDQIYLAGLRDLNNAVKGTN